MSNWVKLKTGDRIEALCELEVTADGKGFRFCGISEVAEGKTFAIWIPDNSEDEGHWYEIVYHPDLRDYAYNLEDPLP